MNRASSNPSAARGGASAAVRGAPRAVVAKLLFTLAAVIAIATWPMAAWRWLLAPALALAALSVRLRLPWRTLLRRLAAAWILLALISLGLLIQPHPALRIGNLFLKAALCLWSVNLLAHAVGAQGVVEALRRLRVPPIWTETLAFWLRYSGVLEAEWRRMQTARQARTFGRNRRLQFRVMTNALGSLFIRAYERAEKIRQAMLARGYRPDL